MGLFGGQAGQQRFYPRPVPQMFKAVVVAVKGDPMFRLRRADDLSMTVELSTAPSLFTWGENLTATCTPAEGGCLVSVGVSGKVGAQLGQSARNSKVVNRLFESVSEVLSSGS